MPLYMDIHNVDTENFSMEEVKKFFNLKYYENEQVRIFY